MDIEKCNIPIDVDLDKCFVSLCVLSIDDNAPTRGISGIYRIRNILNGKTYLGSTQCFRERWQLHLWLLRDGKHHSPHLQSSWVKYGEDAFRFEIVEVASTDGILFLEQSYLDAEFPEYNVSKTAQGRSAAWTEESKAKMRKPKSSTTKQRMSDGVKRSYEVRPELRQLRIDTFRKHRESNPNYNRGANNGFYGKAPNRELLMSPEVQAKRTASLQRAYSEGRAKLRFRPVHQLTYDGELIRYWDSIIEAAKSLGISAGHISNICRGRDKTAGGFQWRYAGERR